MLIHDLFVLTDFLLFGVTLACVAILHRHTLAVALSGLGAIIAKKLRWDGFDQGAGLSGLFAHFAHEWVLLANLFLLLVGFALLARHFEASRIPDWMPAILPDDWRGAFVLLVLIFVISPFLDSIAGALINRKRAGGGRAARVPLWRYRPTFTHRSATGHVWSISARTVGSKKRTRA
jgi:hypothetical protein